MIVLSLITIAFIIFLTSLNIYIDEQVLNEYEGFEAITRMSIFQFLFGFIYLICVPSDLITTFRAKGM